MTYVEKIENLPEVYNTGRKMFVVRAIDIIPPGCSGLSLYTTDAYCVWLENGEYARWPHPFPPTHFSKLPTEKE